MPTEAEMKQFKEEAEKAEVYQRCQKLLRMVGESLYKLKKNSDALRLMEIHLSLLAGALKAFLRAKKKMEQDPEAKTPLEDILKEISEAGEKGGR